MCVFLIRKRDKVEYSNGYAFHTKRKYNERDFPEWCVVDYGEKGPPEFLYEITIQEHSVFNPRSGETLTKTEQVKIFRFIHNDGTKGPWGILNETIRYEK